MHKVSPKLQRSSTEFIVTLGWVWIGLTSRTPLHETCHHASPSEGPFSAFLSPNPSLPGGPRGVYSNLDSLVTNLWLPPSPPFMQFSLPSSRWFSVKELRLFRKYVVWPVWLVLVGWVKTQPCNWTAHSSVSVGGRWHWTCNQNPISSVGEGKWECAWQWKPRKQSHLLLYF